ncbi:hypothetical protein POV27_18615 [Aureisphaera galaxeae]|uniref:transcriptional regulator n=1 Tax=Aureisphaera galaxeae TaxID=1538023 RepID=UPI002350F632|nr:hypothetical protein [Aureisphaera galaxeae]MDC8006072.1 hypothetical protein [Aureisphaera galaxeae]
MIPALPIRTRFVLWTFLILSLSFYAQNGSYHIKQLDSLINVGKRVSLEDPVLARTYYNKVLSESDHPYYQGFARSLIGLTYKSESNFKAAFDNFLEGLTVLEGTDLHRLRASINNNIGLVYQDYGMYDKTLEYYLRSHEIYTTNYLGDRFMDGRVISLLNLIHVRAALENYEEGQKLAETTYDLIDTWDTASENKKMYFVYYNSIVGNMYLQKGDLVKARKYYGAIDLQGIENRIHKSYKTRFHIGLLKLSLLEGDAASSDIYEKKITAALPHLGDKKVVMEAYKALADYYKENGDLAKEVDAKDNVMAIWEDYLDAEKVFESFEINRQKEEVEYKSRISLLEKEQTINKKNRLIIILVFVSILAWIFIFLSRIRKRHREEKEQSEHQKQEYRAQIEESQETLKQKDKELVSHALKALDREKGLSDVRSELDELKDVKGDQIQNKIAQLQKKLDYRVRHNWEEFEKRFLATHESFYQKLKEDFPSLTDNDLNMCALLKLKFSSKEIANLKGISVNSVKVSRYRIRKKLGINNQDLLVDFIDQY